MEATNNLELEEPIPPPHEELALEPKYEESQISLHALLKK